MAPILDTPIEKYLMGRDPYWVKREDLACMAPGPPFAKVRGLYPFLLKLKFQGIETVGYMDTTISMACWGVAFFTKLLGMKAVIYFPRLKEGPIHNQWFQLSKMKEFSNVKWQWLEKPNRLKINWYRAAKDLEASCPHSYMLPQGLPFQETVEDVARQTRELPGHFGTIVTCIGSGTMCAGILKGLWQRREKGTDLCGVMVSPKSAPAMYNKIHHMAGVHPGRLLGSSFFLIDNGWEYTTKSAIETPFPCNPYYDKKAFQWMANNPIGKLKQPVLFWNIGGDYDTGRETEIHPRANGNKGKGLILRT